LKTIVFNNASSSFVENSLKVLYMLQKINSCFNEDRKFLFIERVDTSNPICRLYGITQSIQPTTVKFIHFKLY